MNKIEFGAGYYEWLLYIDGELIYNDGTSFTDYIDSQKENKEIIFNFKENCECYCDMIIEVLKDYNNYYSENIHIELSEKAKEIMQELSIDDYEKIRKVIYDTYYNYYSSIYE